MISYNKQTIFNEIMKCELQKLGFSGNQIASIIERRQAFFGNNLPELTMRREYANSTCL